MSLYIDTKMILPLKCSSPHSNSAVIVFRISSRIPLLWILRHFSTRFPANVLRAPLRLTRPFEAHPRHPKRASTLELGHVRRAHRLPASTFAAPTITGGYGRARWPQRLCTLALRWTDYTLRRLSALIAEEYDRPVTQSRVLLVFWCTKDFFWDTTFREGGAYFGT